jgi:hypothetical protein
MNIFKGVAGLLRKGASGAFADLVGDEVHGPGVGSPSFVDIQFRYLCSARACKIAALFFIGSG